MAKQKWYWVIGVAKHPEIAIHKHVLQGAVSRRSAEAKAAELRKHDYKVRIERAK